MTEVCPCCGRVYSLLKYEYRDIEIVIKQERLSPGWGYSLPEFHFSSGSYDSSLDAYLDAQKRIDGYYRSDKKLI